MLRPWTLMAATAVLIGCSAVPLPAGAAPPHDGNWSVLVITEKGSCDRGYRYNVAVTNGRLRYQGEGSVQFNGTVEPGGAVKVNIRLGQQGANGTGRLSAGSGTGTWRGVGGAGECSGRWEAEKR